MKYFPKVTEISDGQWRLEDDDLVVTSLGYTLVVPAGRQTDLASVPRVAWAIISPFDDGLAGPIVHDELYRHGGWIQVSHDTVSRARWSRAQADAFLRDIMRQDGVSPWRSFLTYHAVRLFGGSSWQPSKNSQ